MTIKRDIKWLLRGRQKRPIFRVMTRPLTPTEILGKAKKINPQISFGDVSGFLKELEGRGILKNLTPEQMTGKIYFLTNYGRRLMWKIFDLKIDEERQDIDWYKYSRILAGRTRKYVMLEIYRVRKLFPDGVNVSFIRKQSCRVYPLTLSQACCTVHDLRKDKLIRVAGISRKKGSKLYKLSSAGIKICKYLLEKSQ